MIGAGLRLTNWLRFKGEHEVTLTEGVTSITATHEDNAARSNWLGKSTILAAIRFALFGVTPTDVLDDAISYGESELGVDLELSDQLFISRTRKRGKSTDLLVVMPDGRELHGDAAQQAIEGHIGLSLDDFERTAWIGQKQIHRFVTATPAERTQIINDWLALGPVEEASVKARQKVGACEREIGTARARLDELGPAIDLECHRVAVLDAQREFAGATALAAQWAACDRAATDFGRMQDEEANLAKQLALLQPEDVETLRGDAEGLRNIISAGRDAEKQLRIARDTNADRRALMQRHAQRDAARVELEQLRARLAVMSSGDSTVQERELGDLAGLISHSRKELADAERLSQGDWDGGCPIACEACPSSKFVRDTLGLYVSRARLEREHLRSLERQWQDASMVLAKLRDTAATRLKLETRIEEVKRAANLALYDITPEMPEPKVPDTTEAARKLGELEQRIARSERDAVQREKLRVRCVAAQAAVQAFKLPEEPEYPAPDLQPLAGKLAQLQAELSQAEARAMRRNDLLNQVKGFEDSLTTWRAAATILGRSGVQRVVSERAVQAIAASANARLATSGINLSVSLVQGKELQGLADVCEACGAAYPKSQRAKTCVACGGARGPKRDDKLHCVLSSRSGAAEDLAGYALQTAAFAWLRRYRGIGLNMIILDEPFGALDSEHRGQLARAILTMARDDHAQCLVVAHSPDLNSTFPSRIEIVGDDEWSRIETT